MDASVAQRQVRIFICQGTFVVPNQVLETTCDAGDFFVAIRIASKYQSGYQTEVVIKRKGQVVEAW